MQRENHSHIGVVQTIEPASYSADETGSGVDLKDFDSATVEINVGVVAGTHTPKLQESDDDATYTDVAADDLIGSFANLAASTAQKVGYIGYKRYVRVFTTSGGGSALYSASVLKGHAHAKPVA